MGKATVGWTGSCYSAACNDGAEAADSFRKLERTLPWSPANTLGLTLPNWRVCIV